MTEEQKNEVEGQVSEPESKEQITLNKEDYAAMVKDMTALKAQLTALQELQKPQNDDEEGEEERPSKRRIERTEGEVDYSQMSPKEFMDHILETVQENIAKPL